MKYLLIVFAIAVMAANVQAQQKMYNHILITNDDGIEDKDRLIALAKHVGTIANRVSIMVSNRDRSGTSNYTLIGKHQDSLVVNTLAEKSADNISIHVVSGNPADCVLLGLSGFFGSDRPDLVLSGINGGPNTGPGWIGSGTIGAIRAAATLGVKGIALSGFDSSDERSFTLVPQWITAFISSKAISLLQKNDYLTIAFPEPMKTIKGVKLIERRISPDNPRQLAFREETGKELDKGDSMTIWRFYYKGDPIDKTITRFDDSFLENGYIVITPMTINENNEPLFKRLVEVEIPDFKFN